MKTKSTSIGILLALLLCVTSSPAVIYPPYQVDSDTLHLWHMDTVAPALDEVPGGFNLPGLHNGATLGEASFSGFGTALNTVDGGQGSTTERNALLSAAAANPPGAVTITVADPDTGAFTFEAIVWIGFDPSFNMGTTANGGNNRNTPLNIISAESSSSAGRIFQFRIVPTGMVPAGGQPPAPGPILTFENIRAVSANQPSIYAPIPLDGPNAIVSNAWYHVAVTYNGEPSTANNIRFYWTRLDPAASTANEIAITSVTTTLTGLNPKATISSPFMIGNDGRSRNSNFIGLIDEVRISRVARGSASMLIGPTEVSVMDHPADEVVAIGQPFSLGVGAAGMPPYSYQWRQDGSDIPDATNSTYGVNLAQLADGGQYDVIVNNASSSATSQVATVTVRNPLTLTWIGGQDWNTANMVWDSNGDFSPDAVYTEGDNVVFNNIGDYLVFLAERMHPKSVTVETATEYIFSTDAGGALERNMSLTKKGNGQLSIETLNTYTGSTDIQAGTLQVGSIVGAGSIGSGFVTNNGMLVLSNGVVNTPLITGSGDVTVQTGTSLSMESNLLTGALVMNGGTVNMNSPAAVGNHPSITMNARPNPGPSINMRGVTIPVTTTISMLGTTASPDTRVTLSATAGTNVIQSPLIMDGNGTVQILTSPEGFMDLAGINSPGYNGKVLLRGSGTNNVVRGPINIGLQVSVADSSTWTFLAPNSWAYGEAAHTSTFRIGVPGALPPASALNVWGGTLDLAGFNAQVSHIVSTNTGSPFAQNFIGKIGNSSTTSDSVFTVHSSLNNNSLTAAIIDSVHGGTRKTSLTLAGGGTLTLGNPTNTYSGDTLISSGTLALSSAGAILNSANIIIAAGSTLDATLRTDQTLTLTPVQTLKGDGAINVLGKLVNQGTLEFKANKSGGVLSGDQLQGVTDLTYGGTLKLVLSGQTLADGDSIKLFDAGSYQGTFASIVPGSPGAGLRWDTSTLTVDGVLRVAVGPDTTPPNISFTMVGEDTVEVEWPYSHTGWVLQAQTNSVSVGLSDNWVPMGVSSSTNRLFIPVDKAQGAVFYRLILP